MSELPEADVAQLAELVRKRYSERLAKFGEDPKTLGWDTHENQQTRFHVATTMQDFSNRTVLDVGCGFGDFLSFLHSTQRTVPYEYRGIDINSDLIERCRSRFPNQNFDVYDFLSDSLPSSSADVVCMFGFLNFRLPTIDNYTFAKEVLRRGFQIAKEALIIDMLSIHRDSRYPKEGSVFYYDPERILSYALTLTPKVLLRHDYPEIPQREFMLALRHPNDNS